MIASSKPLLRSSRRNSALTHSPATVIHHRHNNNTATPATHLGKRAHDLFPSDDCSQVIKRQRLNPKTLSLPKSPVPNHVANTVTTDSSTAVTPPRVNSHSNPRITSAVQPLINGTLATNDETLPHHSTGIVQTARETPLLKVNDKRALRSQNGGSRTKSELSLYFPNYEELISDEPKEIG